MDDPNDDQVPPEDADDTEAMERWRELAHRTQNPMYAWAALEQRLGAALPHDADTTIQGEVVIPAWVAAYLRHIAHNLSFLGAGLDPRIEPAGVLPAGAPFETFEEYLKSPEMKADVERRTIKLKDAMKLVPQVLGLTREEGWNAFATLQADTTLMQEAHLYEELMGWEGMTSERALQQVQQVFGKRSDRQVRRRISEGRKLISE